MKNTITLLICLLISLSSFAQQGINYKAQLKDASGNALANTFMNVVFSIHEITSNGTIIYQEDHSGIMTDANGVLILAIGTDPGPSIGVFSAIDWAAELHFLQTTISYPGGTINFDAEFMAVPYALHARTSGDKSWESEVDNVHILSKNVGIGTTVPDDELHINGGINADIRLEATGSKVLRFYEGATQSGFVGHYTTGMQLVNQKTNSDMRFGVDNSFDLTIQTGGLVGIGTTAPGDLLHVNGVVRIGSAERLIDGGSNRLDIEANFYPSADNTYDLGSSTNRWDDVFATNGTINTSDARDKTQIANLNYGLETVMKLRPVSFQWKNDLRGDVKLGLIAQELLEVIPEVVKTHDDVIIDEETGQTEVQEMERLGVYYSDLIPVLIKAIQEQQEIIDNQKGEIESLTSELLKTKEEQKYFNTRLKLIEQLLNTSQQ